jgi:hypothetical protein
MDFNAQHLAGFALGKDFEWSAADLAIGGKALRWDAGIDHQLKALAAERALDGLVDFHFSAKC